MYYKRSWYYGIFHSIDWTGKKLAESYARLHSLSLGEAFKRALFEKIEDEYDISVYEEAYDEYVKSGCKSTPVADFWKELDGEVWGWAFWTL